MLVGVHVARAQEQLEKNGLRIAEFGPWFEGQEGPTVGADLGTMLIAHTDVAPETASTISKTLAENAEQMAEEHQAWAGFQPEEAGGEGFGGLCGG